MTHPFRLTLRVSHPPSSRGHAFPIKGKEDAPISVMPRFIRGISEQRITRTEAGDDAKQFSNPPT